MYIFLGITGSNFGSKCAFSRRFDAFNPFLSKTPNRFTAYKGSTIDSEFEVAFDVAHRKRELEDNDGETNEAV